MVKLTWVKGQNKALVWVLLLLWTVLLLLFPVRLINEYHSIQAPYLFENLPLFGVLFCLWMLLLMLLLFSKSDDSTLNLENLALACVFGLVFMGFWVVITPYGSYADGIYNMGHVRYLGEIGRIGVGHPSLGYFDFPGMHLLVSDLSQVTGLGVFESTTVFLVFNAMLFSALLYVLFLKTLKSNRLAFLSVLLVMMGNVVLVEKMHILTPGAFGFTLLAGFLVLLNQADGSLFGRTASVRLLMIILFTAMTISYFATSFLAPLVLLGIYGVQLIAKDREKSATVTSITLLLVMVIAWEINWTQHTFSSLVGFLPKFTADLFSGDFLRSVLTLASSSAGASLPLWAIVTRYFWWALLGLGTILGLRNLFRISKLSLTGKIETGGLLGIILLGALGLFGTARGSQFHRYLMYAPLFCSPILLRFLFKSGAWGRKSLVLLTVMVCALALPTFLSSVNTITTDAIYPYGIASGEFLESHSDEQGKELVLFRVSNVTAAWAYYFTPNTSFKSISLKTYFNDSEDELWLEIDKLVDKFQDPGYIPEKQKVFIISEKSTNVFQHLLDILPSHNGWEELRQRLASTNILYDNGHVRMYLP